MPYVNWAKGKARKVPGEDHLGLLSVGIAISDYLLPGITSVTQRARYYSFYSWVIRDYHKSTRTRNSDSFAQYLRRRETAFVLANVSHQGEMGIVGSRRARELWDSNRNTFEMQEHLVQNQFGGYSIYRNAMSSCLLTTLGDATYNDKLQPKGVESALAFEQDISGTRYYRQYLDAERVPRDVINEYGDVAAASRLGQSQDGSVLTGVFFRNDIHGFTVVQRRESLAYFLFLCDALGGEPLNWDNLGSLMYYGQDLEGSALNIPKELGFIADGWVIFWLRQYMVFAIEALWSHFLERLRRGPLTAEHFLKEVASSASVVPEPFEKEDIAWLKLPTMDESFDVWHTWANEVIDLGPIEVELVSLIGQLKPEAVSSFCHVRLPIALLFCIYTRHCNDLADAPNTPLWRLGWTDHKSIQIFFGEMQRLHESAGTVVDLLRRIYEKFIWSQHREVALGKLIAFGYDTLHFVYQDGLYYYRETDTPKFNVFRALQGVQFLRDLNLIQTTEHGDTVTPRGQAVMRTIIAASTHVRREILQEGNLDAVS